MTEEELHERKYSYAEILEWRGIHDYKDTCPTCAGSGIKTYPSTSLWHNGVGGDMISSGTCDICWGTGMASQKGTNLRMVQHKLQTLAYIDRGQWPPKEFFDNAPTE